MAQILQVDDKTCMAIRCGAMTQAQAGQDVLYACAMQGKSVPIPCSHPDCAAFREQCGGGSTLISRDIPQTMPNIAGYLPMPVNVLEQTQPSVSGGSNYPGQCNPAAILNSEMEQDYSGMLCRFHSWVNQNPLLGVGLVVGAFLLMKGQKG